MTIPQKAIICLFCLCWVLESILLMSVCYGRPLCEQNWQRWPAYTDHSFTLFGELSFTTFYKMFGFGPWCWKSIQYGRYFPCHRVGSIKQSHPSILASAGDAADAYANLQREQTTAVTVFTEVITQQFCPNTPAGEVSLDWTGEVSKDIHLATFLRISCIWSSWLEYCLSR